MKPENDIEKLNKTTRKRYLFISMLLLLLAGTILYHAFHVAFIEGPFWRELATRSIRTNIYVAPQRGDILSANYELMATTEPVFQLSIDFWSDALQPDTLSALLPSLSKALARVFPELPTNTYQQHINKGLQERKAAESRIKGGHKQVKKNRDYPLFPNRRRLNYLELQKVRTMPFFNKGRYKSGLLIKSSVKRTKPYGTLASRAIGDIYGEYEKGGKNGLELQYDSLLKGEPGLATRRRINSRSTDVITLEPVPGKDIVTTIDIRIQDITEKALLDKLKEIDAESGTAVVMEVATGEVKAITNMGRYAEGAWTETKNFAVTDQTEPGSTFKIASMMVALEDGVVSPTDSIDTGNGLFPYSGNTVRDHNWHKGGYGVISAEQAIWFSSNIGVAKIILKGYKDNPERFVEGLYKLGLNIPLDLEIPGAGTAKIRKPSDKGQYWSSITLPWMSFGYETQIPPIYTLAFYNAIANKGKMLKPYFVKEIRHRGKIIEKRKPEVLKRKICSQTTLEQIHQMLLGVVEGKGGTGSSVYSEHIRIAGKTGTVQISQGAAGNVSRTTHQVSFCGYFPADKPKYSCIVVIRKPRIGYPSGGTMSGGVVKRIAEEVNAKLYTKSIEELEIDSIHPLLPRVKAGEKQATLQALKKLDLSYTKKGDAEWVRSKEEEGALHVVPISIIDHLVPNVLGMGAKDAVYLLEQKGLRVHLQGRGKVKIQSLLPGTRYTKGQTVGLILD